MLRAVVFDMDETLLSINLAAFIAVLARDESALLAEAGRRSTWTMVAAYTRALLEVNQPGHDGTRTNREIFDAAIERRSGVVLADPVVRDMIECYEREVLPNRNDRIIDADPMPGGIRAVEAALSRGLRVALLTNPSFSETCIRCRMRWGGLEDLPFELVTTLENSRHCKPDAAYYRESLSELGLSPDEVLMVGNDPKRDFPEPDCGLKTAYVGDGAPARAMWAGTMERFGERFDEVVEAFEGD
ncbi:MAG: HAD family hydrolase [Coriobacteriaceae bacterium]|nr:HAD family hydrolase [Coriobacteriaceae bacterium]